MRLTNYTNYSMRILMYCALRPAQTVRVQDIARDYGISRAHLLKSARHLGHLGYLKTIRGRNGGIRLARPPAAVSVGDVVRALEDSSDFVECFNPATNQCPIAGVCGLSTLLREALAAFYRELDRRTLADLVANASQLRQRLSLPEQLAPC